jgi:hypothetical protein
MAKAIQKPNAYYEILITGRSHIARSAQFNLGDMISESSMWNKKFKMIEGVVLTVETRSRASTEEGCSRVFLISARSRGICIPDDVLYYLAVWLNITALSLVLEKRKSTQQKKIITIIRS